MKIHPINFIFFGLFICSIGFNILYHNSNQKLVYRIQKLEAGPAQGLFLYPNNNESGLSNEEIKELLKEILQKKLRDRTV